MHSYITLILVIVSVIPVYAQYFVATNGSDINSGTFEAPLKTISKAVSMVSAGDTISVRGGTYSLTSTITIDSSRSGSDLSRCYLVNYEGEQPLLDFSQAASGVKGLKLTANYWHIRGLTIKGAGGNGLEINRGAFNIIENCTFFENRNSGLQLSNNASDNRIINCDSYDNADPPDFGDADGFAPKLDAGNNNYFYGCRAWGNCDDGWDGYLRGTNNIITFIENCWTWGNGYLKDGTDPGSQANGNGFKMGGGDNSNNENLMHHVTLINCVAFKNKAKGFDQNNNAGSMTLFNCSSYANKGYNYKINRTLMDGQSLILRNCVSFEGGVDLGGFAIQQCNSWLSPFIVSSEDFQSLADSLAESPRKPDGSLPDISFLHLNSSSDLIDGGVDIGLPFNGTAPDLGAFETDPANVCADNETKPCDFRLFQNYPNPFNPGTFIEFDLTQSQPVLIKIFNVKGQEITTLAQGWQASGMHSIYWNAGSETKNLSSGLYYLTLKSVSFSQIIKMVYMK